MRTRRSGADLHTHTTASDGACTPAELVARADRAGLAAVAITDHDTLQGLPEALAAAALPAIRVRVIAGIEIAVRYKPGKFHLLGYFVDPASPSLGHRLAVLGANRSSRNERMIERLQAIGLDLTADDVRAASGGGQIGRPHMAAALMAKGVVQSVQEAFDRFLGSGCPGHVPKDKIGLEEGIALVHEAGGAAVVAHPLTLGHEMVEMAGVFARLRGLGLDGAECWYPQHTTEQARALAALARRAGLTVTGGSDFHGDTKPNNHLGQAFGGCPAPLSIVRGLEARLPTA